MSDPGKEDAPTTIIGSTIIIRGKLKSDEDLVVEGRIEAEITSSKALVIENSGIVKASMQVKSARVSGVVVGNITAASKVEIAPDGRVVGDILTPKLVIRDGAAFRGRIDMPDFEAPRARVPEPVPTIDTSPTLVTAVPVPVPVPVVRVPDPEPAPLVEPEAPLDDPWAPLLSEPPASPPSVLFSTHDTPPPSPPAKPAMSAERERELGSIKRKRF